MTIQCTSPRGDNNFLDKYFQNFCCLPLYYFSKMALLPGIVVFLTCIEIVSLVLSFVYIAHIAYSHLFILILVYVYYTCTCFFSILINLLYHCLFPFMFTLVWLGIVGRK